jgi:hypothetical protein
VRAANVVLVNKTTLRCGGFNKPTHYRHGLRDGRFAARGFSVLGDGDLGFAWVVGYVAGGLASAGAIGSIPTERSRSRRPVVPTDAMGNLSADLTGPVQLALARSVEQLPGKHGMPGGSRYELKWDGFLH